MVDIADPIEIAGMAVRNRTAMQPMVTNFGSRDKTGKVTDQLVRYHEARSKGGVGLIIVEATAIHWTHRLQRYSIGIHDDNLIPGLTKLADGIKAHGARAFIQLVHGGAKSRVTERPVGPSPIRLIKDAPLPEELSVEEIETIKDWFVDAARRSQEAGFDGIEIHAAHGYLLSAFLSSYSNRRQDAYGGTTEKNAKLTVDVIKAIRKKLGSYPMIIRMHGIENFVRGIDIEEAKQIAQLLERAGADVINISGFEAPYFNSEEAVYTPDTRPEFMKGFPEGCFVPCAAKIKEVINIPVIGVGKVRDAAFAKKVIQEELCDMIGLARGLLADPLFVEKTLSGKGDTIEQCIDCDECFARLGDLEPFECSVNHDLGNE